MNFFDAPITEHIVGQSKGLGPYNLVVLLVEAVGRYFPLRFPSLTYREAIHMCSCFDAAAGSRDTGLW